MNGLRLLLLFPFMLGACGAPGLTGPAVEGSSLLDGLKKQVEVSYPSSFRAQHRVTLSFRGKQFDFNGYLLVRRPGAWRAVAFGEFGGSMFDIAAFPGRGLRIIKNPGGIRESWLTGPAADIIQLLYLPPAERTRAGRGGAIYEITYSDFALFPGGDREIPRHIAVENKSLRLRLDLDLIKLEPMELPDKYFDL